MKPYHIVLILILAVRRVEILVPMYNKPIFSLVQNKYFFLLIYEWKRTIKSNIDLYLFCTFGYETLNLNLLLYKDCRVTMVNKASKNKFFRVGEG